jgi:hypothetical protein
MTPGIYSTFCNLHSNASGFSGKCDSGPLDPENVSDTGVGVQTYYNLFSTMAEFYKNDLLAPYLALPQGDKIQAECMHSFISDSFEAIKVFV